MFKTNDKNTLNFSSLCGFDHLVEVTQFDKKKNLDLNDIYALRFAAMRFFGINDFITDALGFDDTNAMQDDELYLNSFDGIYFDDGLKFDTILMHETGIFLLRVYNEETDDFTFYMAN